MDVTYGSKKTVTVGPDDDNKHKSFEMNTLDFTSVIDSAFVYPSYKSIKGKELKEVSEKLTFYYKCDSSTCKFPMTELMQSVELKALGIRNITHLLVNTISENQDLFTARQCGGYIFQANGHSEVLIKNQSIVDPRDETRFAFIDLTEARRQLIYKHEIDLLRKRQIDMVMMKPSLWANVALGGGVVGGAFVYGVLKVLKKIR
mmetsp:Transcript_15667/g.21495  ORF Transcript_15667/g.21495 Transcript_15667/m.21495 type:complete len:203 (+) Transcript_15667:64-672(+)|eukprot:CAMPEP_0170073826 /NCGR_PEP_ID=MMETSP0019_2-20121128/11204_1 /TAXON_ID=98059 /ORGANISM="Dinobryon sp., Strain UTEXLB2267" /LENGTH=202 /DNA_ID=CAMNT_0010283665 /DNA_START=276 /DNA_END=884 /DNA_ORIENTATION=-